MDQGKETCSICGKELNKWTSPLKKYQGKKICGSCGLKLAKGEISQAFNQSQGGKAQEVGQKMQSMGKKLTVGLTIPLILFVIGLATFPLGILFWLVAIIILFSVFSKKKKS